MLVTVLLDWLSCECDVVGWWWWSPCGWSVLGKWKPRSQSLPEPNGSLKFGLQVVGCLRWEGAVWENVVEEARVAVEVEEVVDDVNVGWIGGGSEDGFHKEDPSNAAVCAAVAVGV